MRANDRTKPALPTVGSDDVCNVPCFKADLVARLRAKLPDDETLAEALILFGALADRMRLKILYALKDGDELCVCDVAHLLSTNVSVASHHLRKLRDLRMLRYRNDGKMAYYSLREAVAAELVTRALETAEV